jgi:sugar phosphate isomerase/epimerase
MNRRAFLGCAASAASRTKWAERLGVMCQYGASERNLREALAAARRAGFRRIQVFFPWDKVETAFLKALPGWLRAEELACPVLSAYVNCVSPQVPLMNTRAEDLPRAIDYAGQLGATHLVAWTGSYSAGLTTADPRNHAPAAADAIERYLAPHLRRLEQARVILALETYMTLVCPDAPALRRLLDRLPTAVGAVLDPPNLTPLARYAGRDAALREMFETLAGRIAVVHLKDFKLAKDGKSYDLPGPLAGAMNYPLFVERIRALPETVPVIAEHLGPPEFAAARRKLLPLFGE